MKAIYELTIPALFAETVRNFGQRGFIARVGEKPKTYHETRKEVRALISLFEKMKIVPGDRIAILGYEHAGVGYFILCHHVHGSCRRSSSS